MSDIDYDDDYVDDIQDDDDDDLLAIEDTIDPASDTEGIEGGDEFDDEDEIDQDVKIDDDDDDKSDSEDDEAPVNEDAIIAEAVANNVNEPTDIESKDSTKKKPFESLPREEIIVLDHKNYMSSNILTKFEMTEIVSIRATQISQHNNCMVNYGKLDDPIKMAKLELMMRKCPLIVRRPVGLIRENGVWHQAVEDWNPNTMAFSVSYNNVL